MKQYNYKISVIIPIYNAELFLQETINSVINQTIGFKNNIQLILVNDGSIDNSEKICLKYKKQYPENIIYIKQENQGVSVARNNGLKHAEGEYINFLDSDDKWDLTAYAKGVKMLNENKSIDLVSYRIKFFDSTNRYHPLDYKYQKDMIVDINIDYKYIQMSSSSVLLRRSAIGNIRYDKNLKISEDAKFISEILFKKCKYGIISSSIYYYRRSFLGNSAIQTSLGNKSWYLDTPKYCYEWLCEYSKKKFKCIIPYVQYIILYDFRWRLFMDLPSFLTVEEKKSYTKSIKKILNWFDDQFIIKNSNYNIYGNIYALNFKYGINNKLDISDNSIYYNNILIGNSNNLSITINNIMIKDNNLILYGTLPIISNIIEKVFIIDQDNKTYKFNYYDLDVSNANFPCINNEHIITKKGVHIELPLENKKKLRFITENGLQISFNFSYSANLNDNFKSLYLNNKNYILKNNKNNNYLDIYKSNFKNKIKFELKCIYNLLLKKKIKSLLLRECSYFFKLFKRRDIWLVSDRLNMAGDNGEALFKYLTSNKNVKAELYFVISNKSSDYNRMKQYGKVINPDSFKYKMLFLNSNIIISSHADDYVFNPFGTGKYYLSDLYKFKYVFLQHGIIKDDLSPWLNINSKQIDIFVTSAKDEYKSLLEYNYNYGQNVVRLTGLPRYDYLLSNDIKQEKTILLAPTWRSSLASKINSNTGEREYNDQFVNSNYYKFYNNLINDERLLRCLKKHGYKIRFIPHPNMLVQINDFKGNKFVEFQTGVIRYNEEFKRNSLLITDYSSVFFDFGYLKKPVIYSQFDTDDFYQQQIYDKGYFNFKTHGFGPVCNDYETTIQEIIKAIENNCKLEEIYSKRIKSFFFKFDSNNCNRVYNEIKKL